MPSFNTENMGFVMKTCFFVCYITCLLLQLALIIQNVSTKQKIIILGHFCQQIIFHLSDRKNKYNQ